MINENRLFKLLPSFFQSPRTVLIEIAQNAHRSGAANLEISITKDLLEVTDDGTGTANLEALFSLAESDWSEEVMENQVPAGWGLFFLISISNKITYRSLFGEVNVNCETFLNDKSYRDNLFAQADSSLKTERGFHIKAVLKEGIFEKMFYPGDFAHTTADLSYFPMSITVNGKQIKQKKLSVECEQYPIKTRYLDNDVYVNPLTHASLFTVHDLCVLWYGIPVNFATYLYNTVIDVQRHTPVTPVLPYRSAIKDDEKAKAFFDFLRGEVRVWCLKELENYKETIEKGERSRVLLLLKIAGQVCTQDELDKLDLFYVDVVDLHSADDVEAYSVIEKKIVSRLESPLITERLVLKGGLEYDEEENGLDYKPVLPAWTITLIDLPEKRPTWLKTEEKVVNVEVSVQETFYKNYTWHRCLIKCAEKDIKVIASSNVDSSETNVYFSECPENFWEIQDAVFKQRIYCSDGDTYDTQEYRFSKDIDKDIVSINGRYPLSDLLKGISITSIDPLDIKSIDINNKDNTMQVMKTNGEAVTLMLAA